MMYPVNLYCRCGKRISIPPINMFPEWTKNEWRKLHSGLGHGIVDYDTWSKIRANQLKWGRMRANNAKRAGIRASTGQGTGQGVGKAIGELGARDGQGLFGPIPPLKAVTRRKLLVAMDKLDAVIAMTGGRK